jgi:hypothetical protein
MGDRDKRVPQAHFVVAVLYDAALLLAPGEALAHNLAFQHAALKHGDVLLNATGVVGRQKEATTARVLHTTRFAESTTHCGDAPRSIVLTASAPACSP